MGSIRRVIKAASNVADKNSVIVRNLQWFSGSKEIKTVLEKYGKISDIIFFRNDQTVGNGGMAKVKFEDLDSVEKVLNAPSIKIDGLAVRVMKDRNE